MSGYPNPYNGQPNINPTQPQPGFFVPNNPGMPAQYPSYQYGVNVYPVPPGQAGQPISAMSYPGMQTAPPPTAPAPGGYPGYPNLPAQPGYPNITPQPGYPSMPAQPGYTQAVEWIPTTPANAHTLTNMAVVGGYEGHDGSPLWVIRAKFEGDLIPGKLPIKHKVSYVPWGGKENQVQEIEVCCTRQPERVKWVKCRDGSVPPNAIAAGKTANGETLFVGRAHHERSLTPGKVHPSHKGMYISFAGQEIPHKEYEVLCTA